MAEKRKEIKVAKIIDNTSLVINAGEHQGIKKGDKFQIIGKKGSQSVIDPDTGEDLGTLDEIKGKVTVQEVYPNMAVCKSQYVRDEVNINNMVGNQMMAGMNKTLSEIKSGVITSGHYESLNVEPTQITGGFKESDDPIRVGDIASPIK